MVEIGDTIVSFDLFEQQFCCDLDICKGQCCVEGDAGAPLEMDEIAKLEEVLPVIWNDLSEAARKVVDAQGVAYSDAEGDLVTSIVNRRECVFSYIDSAEGVCKCAIEKAYHEGKTSFYKPISCHLYPIRLKKFKILATYHRWSVCSCAETKDINCNCLFINFLKLRLFAVLAKHGIRNLRKAVKRSRV